MKLRFCLKYSLKLYLKKPLYEANSPAHGQNILESSTFQTENEAPMVIEKSSGRIEDMFTAQIRKRPNGESESTPKRRKINSRRVVPKRLEMSTKRNNSEKTLDIQVSEQKDERISLTSGIHTETAGPGENGVGKGQFSIGEILKEKIAASKITRIIQEQTDSGPRIVYELEKDF